MPDMDGTGPQGKGPRTGRQLGKCEGAEVDCPRRKFGKGQNFKRGFRNRRE